MLLCVAKLQHIASITEGWHLMATTWWEESQGLAIGMLGSNGSIETEIYGASEPCHVCKVDSRFHKKPTESIISYTDRSSMERLDLSFRHLSGSQLTCMDL